MSHAAVLLWSSHDRCDVWCEDGKAWRSRADAVTPRTGPVPETLVRVAGEIRVFSTIAEGQRVRWVRGTLVVEGHVAEKCRYGALVITSSGRLMAVGFRMLWPAVVCSVA
jgi:hypothetical protein